MQVTSVRFEHHRDPLGIGESRPRLSWKTLTDMRGWRQAGYEIEVTATSRTSATGRLDSGESVLVPWPDEPLSSGESRSVRVRVWGSSSEEPSGWSEPHRVEAGLLRPDDWTAQMIAPGWRENSVVTQPVPMFRREFELSPAVSSARLYATAQGVYEIEINGQRVGDHVMAPGWTSYHHRLRYQTYDVTALLAEGANAIGAYVGEGWFRGRLTWDERLRNIYGDKAGLLAQLHVTYADGTSTQLGTDSRWTCATGPIIASGIYDGETYDARLERSGWSESGGNSDWAPVEVQPFDLSTLVAPTGPPVRRTQTLSPAAITTSPSGRTIVDFGQNVVGRVRLRVRGEAGQTVTLRHAEVLEHGELAVQPLRSAKATDQYTLRGGAVEEWEPRFTFHGFRYVEVDGWPGALRPEDVTAAVCHTDMERTGWFEASEPLLEKLHENIVWSMRGNFFDVPTDCPQRDERLGWTGDLQLFAPTATYLYDCAGTLVSWLRDLSVEQLADDSRMPPLVVPNVLENKLDAAAWGDVTVIAPWVIYQRFGDPEVLRAQFASMTAWVDGVESKVGQRGLWDGEWQFGDWLDPTAPPDQPAAARTPVGLVATAHLARSAELVSRIAQLLGDTDAAQHYAALAARIRRAFADEYVTLNGLLAGDSQTAYALAIEFGLLEKPGQRDRAGRRLTQLVHEGEYRIGTGFVGTPLIADALCAAGETQLAYRVLLEKSCPSFLYPLTMDATTVWERWDSMLPDGQINSGAMTSFNHYALGAVADWLHRSVAGLAPGAPGYRQLIVAPQPGGGLTHAAATHETPYGRASVAWRLDGDTFRLDVIVPPNCSATVRLPGGSEADEVGAGTHRYAVDYHPPPYPPEPGILRPVVA